MKNKKIAIIGGGITGLTLGYLLSKEGAKVMIFEKEKNIGGLLAVTGEEDAKIERTYHQFFTHDTDLIELIQQLDLYKSMVFYPAKTGIYRDGRLYPFSGPKDLLLLPLITLPTKIRMGIATLELAFLKYQSSLEGQRAKAYIERTMGKEGWSNFWELLFWGKFGDKAQEISAVWFWSRTKSRFLSRKGGREAFGYLKGSFNLLIEGLEEAIKEMGGELVAGRAVRKIERVEGRMVVDGRAFDVAISTVPVPILKKLTDIPEVVTLPATGYRAFVGALFEANRQFSQYYWLNVFDKKAPFEVVVEQTNWLPDYYPGKHLIYVGKYLSGQDDLYCLSKDETLARFGDYLSKIQPGIKLTPLDFYKTEYAQPVITYGYKPLPNKLSKNFYITSLEHTYPADRGMSAAIKEAKKIINILTKDSK